MKSNVLKWFTAALALLLAFGLLACGGGTDTPRQEKEVSKIEVSNLPTQTDYYVGDTFSAAGGKLVVTYTGGESEELLLTAPEVELSEVNTDRPGDKTVTVKYGGKRTTFKVTVSIKGFAVTFVGNYDGAGAPTVVNVQSGKTVEAPSVPLRTGFAFYAWYTNADCTVPYDFTTQITGDTALYAAWKQNGATYFAVEYDLNYYGCKPQTFVQAVKSGEAAKPLGLTPSRAEYVFDGWKTDAAGSTAFSVESAITANTTVYAKWNKTKTAASSYVFEAEKTDLTGKTGPGFSGTAQEESMIVTSATLAASGGRFISYLYRNNSSLEFRIASSEAVSNATLTVRLAAEMDNINFSSDEYQVKVNGIKLPYGAVSLINGAAFTDAITISNVVLQAGENLIQLVTSNNRRPMGEGSTYEATAPMVDCITLTTTAVLIWDANYQLPKSY